MLRSRTFSTCSIFLLALGIGLYFGCGGGGSGGAGSGGTGSSTGTTGGTTSGTGTGGGTGSFAAGPVILVVEENHGFSTLIGNSAMPYLNSLAQQYGLGTQYYANTHPSSNNYFEMTAGSAIAPPPNPDSFDGPANVDNIVRHLIAAGKTWKAYAESLPRPGYTGSDSGAYVHHHNPLSYFTDVVNDPSQRTNLVPFDQFAIDLNAGALPSFSFVGPNKNNNAHSCPVNMAVCVDSDKLKTADNWLKTNIDPVLSSAQFKQNGLLIIVFDEAEQSDIRHGGGQVAVVVIGPKVKTGFQSTTLHQHQDLLKMITTYIGIDSNIGNAANAAGMTEFLQ
jgi:acid phosphatase